MNSIILLVSMMVPVAITLAALLWMKWRRENDGRRSPLNEKLFHQPGQQLRKRLEALTDDYWEKVSSTVLIGPVVLAAYALGKIKVDALRLDLFAIALLVTGAGLLLWNIRALRRITSEVRSVREGLAAEMATAQYLLPLQAKGFQIFHDLPAGTDKRQFNLDHVVVGPNQVFLIETKSRRKPDQKGKDAATVIYDGNVLKFPGWEDRAVLQQAKAEAEWLAKYLRDEVGESVVVVPIVALPGWAVDFSKAARADVRVINPKLHHVFEREWGTPIPEFLRRRIATALIKRYPELD